MVNFMRTQMNRHPSQGFTLIELMIVVAIIAILAVIAFPIYQKEVIKGKRAEGKAALLQAAQIEERYYTANNQYGTLVQAGINGLSGDNNTNAAYTISISLLPAGGPFTTFTLNAAPRNFTDTACQALTLTNTGVKGSAGSVTVCWH